MIEEKIQKLPRSISIEFFAQSIGANPKTFHRIRLGQAVPPYDMQISIVNFFNEHGVPTTLDEMQFGQHRRPGRPPLPAPEPEEVIDATEQARKFLRALRPPAISIEDLVPQRMVAVPLVGRVAAGTPVLAEENIEGERMLPKTLVRERGVGYSLKIYGDSMEALRIFEGDEVLVTPDESPKFNKVVVATHNGETTCKGYVVNDANEAVLRAYPLRDPERYPDILVDKSTVFHGIVTGVIQGEPDPRSVERAKNPRK